MQSYGTAPPRVGKVAPGIIGRRLTPAKPAAPHVPKPKGY